MPMTFVPPGGEDLWVPANGTIDDPMTSHCVICGQLRWLSDLEIFRPEERSVQLRCHNEIICAQDGGRTDDRVSLIEEPDGMVRLDEPPAPVGRKGWRIWRGDSK